MLYVKCSASLRLDLRDSWTRGFRKTAMGKHEILMYDRLESVLFVEGLRYRAECISLTPVLVQSAPFFALISSSW